jgi:Uma2 family endonuclease
MKALIRAEDLERIQAQTGNSYELVCGELLEQMTAAGRRGMVQGRFARRIDEWSDNAKAGNAATDRGFTLRRTRIPSVVRT